MEKCREESERGGGRGSREKRGEKGGKREKHKKTIKKMS